MAEIKWKSKEEKDTEREQTGSKKCKVQQAKKKTYH